MTTGSVAVVGGRLKRQGVRIKYKKPTKMNARSPILRLPFVTRKVGFWDMPEASGYGSGCDMGVTAAKAFMKALRAGEMNMCGSLQHIVLDLLKQGEAGVGERQRGQIVGFFSHLDMWLVASAQMLGSNLDKVSEADIEDAMTRAANETEEEHTARHEVWIKARLESETEAA